MAQKVNIVMIDDIDGTEIPGDINPTISFGLDGTFYEIDLNAKNAADLRQMLDTYIGAGRKQKKPPTKAAKNAGAVPVPSLNRKRTEAETIRAWAGANGYEVAERGRIPARVKNAYFAAMQQLERHG